MSRIIGRVVVGVSGSPENLHALRHAVELARCYEATLIAVNAQGLRAAALPFAPRTRRARARRAEWQHTACTTLRIAFDEALGGLPEDVACMLLAAPGKPGPALLAVAERANDVLVLGARRRPRPLNAPRHAIAAFCVEHAGCSVFTVPPPPMATRRRAVARIPA